MDRTYSEMILYGAGGHAKVVYDCLVSQGDRATAIFDDDHSVKSFLDLKVVSPYSANYFEDEKLIISIGSNKWRFECAKSISHEYGKAIHKTGVVSPHATIGEGSMVLMRSVIQAEASVGNHVIINTGAIVEHNCVIGDFTHIAPGVVICGNVRIGTGTLIGANATILPGVTIGSWVNVGAGSVVLKDVADGTKVAGNPATILKN